MRNFKNAIVTFLSALLLMSLIMQAVGNKGRRDAARGIKFYPCCFWRDN